MQVRIAFKKFITTLGIFIISLGIRYFGLKGYFAFEEQIIDATSTYFADLVWFALKVVLGLFVLAYLIEVLIDFKALWKSI